MFQEKISEQSLTLGEVSKRCQGQSEGCSGQDLFTSNQESIQLKKKRWVLDPTTGESLRPSTCPNSTRGWWWMRSSMATCAQQKGLEEEAPKEFCGPYEGAMGQVWPFAGALLSHNGTLRGEIAEPRSSSYSTFYGKCTGRAAGLSCPPAGVPPGR